MLEKIQKRIEAYVTVRDRATEQISKLKHKKNKELRAYWAGVVNCAKLMIKDLIDLRTELEMLDNNIDIDLSKLRGEK